tara:strand:+ start:129 stop:674 length:546 start_codon:yes stop_codon:yes gene_type:complete
MFGKTDLTKIEKLLQRIIANQNKLLACWEDEAPVAKPAKTAPEKLKRAVGLGIPEELSKLHPGTVLQEKKGISVEVAIINYFTAKVSKSASAEALISRMSWWRNYYNGGGADQLKGKERQTLVVNGLVNLLESKQLVAKTGIRLGSLTVLFGLSSNIPTQKRISLAKAKALLKLRFPEDIK